MGEILGPLFFTEDRGLIPSAQFHPFGFIVHYIFTMNDLWKTSKSTVLTLAITVIAGISVLAFAYHLRHYTEILSGVIGGLTIILGMVTAEWLRSAREDAEEAEQRLRNLTSNFYFLMMDTSFLLENPYEPRARERRTMLYEVIHELNYLCLKTRWPQVNAKKIRSAALELLAGVLAMIQDADHKEHLWSTEKRFALAEEEADLIDLMVAGTKKEDAWIRKMILQKRETKSEKNGMNIHWLRQAELERQRNA